MRFLVIFSFSLWATTRPPERWARPGRRNECDSGDVEGAARLGPGERDLHRLGRRRDRHCFGLGLTGLGESLDDGLRWCGRRPWQRGRGRGRGRGWRRRRGWRFRWWRRMDDLDVRGSRLAGRERHADRRRPGLPIRTDERAHRGREAILNEVQRAAVLGPGRAVEVVRSVCRAAAIDASALRQEVDLHAVQVVVKSHREVRLSLVWRGRERWAHVSEGDRERELRRNAGGADRERLWC